jgi:hypothetical protein
MIFVLLAAAGAALQRPSRAVLYIDPCKDALTEVSAVQAAMTQHGVHIVPLWSEAMADEMSRSGHSQRLSSFYSDATHRAPAAGDECRWAEEHLDGMHLEAVLCGSDGGLACAERLQHILIPERSNGIDPARRDKYLMNEKCRAAGIAVAAQSAPETWEAAAAFLTQQQEQQTQQQLRAVLKPRRGQASVGVRVAHSLDEARDIYRVLSRSLVSIDTSEVAEARAVVVQVIASNCLELPLIAYDELSLRGGRTGDCLYSLESPLIASNCAVVVQVIASIATDGLGVPLMATDGLGLPTVCLFWPARLWWQELLDGDEWVVDTVSCKGEHKVVALWRYAERLSASEYVWIASLMAVECINCT